MTRTIETLANNITTNTIINSTTNIIPMNITHDNGRNNINTHAAQNDGETQPYNENDNADNRTLQTANPNVRNFNLASKLNVLNIKSICYFKIINEF